VSTVESDTRVRAAAIRATLLTTAVVVATFVPVLNFFALFFFSMPLGLFRSIDSIELGRFHGEYTFRPNALGYVISSVVVWIVSFFLFFSSLPRKKTPE
jgi:hypothetical protein